MEVCNPKGGRSTAPAFLAMLLMMLLNASCCGAAVLAKSNTSFRCSDGRLDECLIEEDLELELEFLINPYVSRILGTSDRPNTEDRNNSAFTCGRRQDPKLYKCIKEVKPDTHNPPSTGVYQRYKPSLEI